MAYNPSSFLPTIQEMFVISRKMKGPLLIVVLSGIFIYNHFLYDPAPEDPIALTPELTDTQKESIKILNDLTQLLFSLGTAIFAVVGALILQLAKREHPLPHTLYYCALASLVFAAISIDYGYIYLEKSAVLLALNMFDPFNRLIVIPQTLQVTTFLLALFFLARLVIGHFSLLENSQSND